MTYQVKQQQQLDDHQAERRLAEAVRRACLEAAQAGYEQAGWDGLCREGAWECALEAIRSLDLEEIIQRFPLEEK
ncbi:MAG: acetyltransferase [Chloroflexota bacterium]